MKNADLPELRAAIAAVAEGIRYISAEVEQIMSDDPPLPHLSTRQLEVLKLVARGLSNTEIAKVIGISAPVVNEHVMAVLTKIGAANRTEAVSIAIHKHLAVMGATKLSAGHRHHPRVCAQFRIFQQRRKATSADCA